ncbi:MAG: hypothetical protein GXP23_12360 [Gammaproteobacteria bacterium]|nr:hypothetical protein [Gammaproteobacteria bacterium]
MKLAILLRRVVITITSLSVAFTLIALLVNLAVFDEDLKPEVTRIQQPAQTLPTEGNAYFAIWGMGATDDQDIVKTGVRLIKRLRQNREASGLDALETEDYVEILGAINLDEEWMANYYCNSRTQYGCLAKIRADLHAAPITGQRLLLMLDRHKYVLQIPTFRSLGESSFVSPVPPFGTMMKLSQLRLASLYDSGSPAEFLAQLAVDIRFWRMLLEQGSGLLDKMVGVAGIWTDVQYLSEYLTARELSQDETQIAMSLLKPLTRNELNIGDAFEAEQRTLFQVLTTTYGKESLRAFGPLVTNWLIQTNATQNSYYQNITRPMLRLSALSEAEFTAQERTREQQNKGIRRPYGRDAMTANWPTGLYNLSGKILLAKMLGYPENYIARVHDVNSMIDLVRFQLSLQSKDVAEDLQSPEDFPASPDTAGLLSSGALARKGLTFEPEGGWLQFDCLDKSSLCQIKLYSEKTN